MRSLFYGDNLEVLRSHVADESVDLIYLDPPFNSKRDYNVLFEEHSGASAAAQIKAFGDTWKWDSAAEDAYQDVVERGGKVADALIAFRTMVGASDVLAYLSMMAPRLIELHRVLRPHGSIYLHCDPTASHYLKLLMDSIYGARNYLNEIVWHYKKWPSGKYTFQRNHDVILFYAKNRGAERTFNQLYMERAESTLKRFGTAKIVSGHDEKGRRVPSQTEDEDSPGVRQDDVWNIGRVPPIKQIFPTEKPAQLLERVLLASSEPGDVVLDPFCGCGTTIVAAENLGRKWIGIDITHISIGLIKHRLADLFGLAQGTDYTVTGEPVALPDAEQLAGEDKYQFQYWALGLVGARPVPSERRKGADKGIDGRRYFLEDAADKPHQIIFSVKGGGTGVKDVRDLRGTIEREKAAIGIFISLRPLTPAMRMEATEAGYFTSKWSKTRHPRVQLFTVAELLDGKRLDLPPLAFKRYADPTFKRAKKVGKRGKSNGELDV